MTPDGLEKRDAVMVPSIKLAVVAPTVEPETPAYTHVSFDPAAQSGDGDTVDDDDRLGEVESEAEDEVLAVCDGEATPEDELDTLCVSKTEAVCVVVCVLDVDSVAAQDTDIDKLCVSEADAV